MAEKREVVSELGRARMRALFFMELLPEEVRLDAKFCMNELVDVAEREIEKAYWDGFKQHRLQMQTPKPSTASQDGR